MGLEMQSSVELLVIELGLSIQPFREDFNKYHHWVTHSWMKSVWEKSSRLRIEVTLADLPSQPPRERDSWLMQEFCQLRNSNDGLQRLNRVRMHQQVLFLSDVMDASGRAIDRKYLHPRPMDETWSDLVFSNECPASRDFRMWKEAIPQIRALGGRLHLGRYIQQGHKIWGDMIWNKAKSTTARASSWTFINHPSLRVHARGQIDTQGPVMTMRGVHKADHAR
jgi:hypothetical protein